jgi:hypothetical protein
MSTLEKHNKLDKYELYSFCIEMYTLVFFYLFISDLSFIKLFIVNLLGNIFFHYIFNFNIIKLLTHNYWRSNLHEIAMPQLITCCSTLLILNNFKILNNYSYIIFPSNILLNYFISKFYKNEIRESINLRIIIITINLLYYLFF